MPRVVQPWSHRHDLDQVAEAVEIVGVAVSSISPIARWMHFRHRDAICMPDRWDVRTRIAPPRIDFGVEGGRRPVPKMARVYRGHYGQATRA
jgi:hypothetical protein